ncbi:protein NLP5-like [Rutidosis leptorrhynchoides]|uniref:protein NLP5-like n=1 Tax=Rutidosis leptorrhynchoides TaxID=125765 RepID=UPI003A98F391
MDENAFNFENPSDSLMDFDYMDELLSDGCWLQATDGSESSNNNIPSSNPLFDSSFQWPNLQSDPVSNDIILSPGPNSSKPHVKNLVNLPNQSENLSDSSKSWWIAPMASSGPSYSVMERLVYAIDNIKHYTVDKNVLIQVWLPEVIKGKKVLTTSQRLFSLELNCPRLSNYRNISERYHFSAEGDAKESVGLPGRVYMGKVPEWTPDVRLFKIEEYPRVSHAQKHGVRGSVAVPVFDQDVKNCIGVVEVVMTTRKSNYSLEIQSVCKALEAVDLRSSEDSNTQIIKVHNGFYHPALSEILEALKSACMMHNLPLAQTWMPCIQQGGKGGCRHSNENLIRCISTVDSASYVSDPRFNDFQEACSQHHLFIGQGVVGKAFETIDPCYSSDVTSYTKTEYPLAHHAKIFDLHAAVAIRLRTKYGDRVDFVLEFFLPVDCDNVDDQNRVINSILIIIEKVCGSLRIVTEMELQEEGVNEELVISDTEPFLNVQETNGHGSGSGSGSGSGMEKRRAGAKLEKTITLEMLRKHFAGSLKDAAKNLGVCPTTLKRICRQHGIQRWPSRKIKKVGHSLRKIQLVMDSVHGGSGSFQIESFYSNFPKLASPDPSKPTHVPFPVTKIETFDLKANDGPTSCSPSSSSGHSFSNGTHHIPIADEGIKNDQNQNVDLEQHQELKIFMRSDSHKALNETPLLQNQPPKPRVKPEGHLWRVKVTFGEEKIRFRMQKDWGYNELLQETAKRFNLNDTSGYSLRYLDDDSEWVLPTCDADVDECIDVYRLLKGGTIRLVLREPQLRVGSSLGSNAPL